MRAVGIKVLKNKLSEYVRLPAAGETVLVTDRDRVVAELVPPRVGRAAAPVARGPAGRVARRIGRGSRGPVSDDRPFVYLDTSVALAHLLSETEVPRGVRTLDALHLASMLFLRSQGAAVELATYDRKPRAGAEALDFESYRL